MNLEPGESATLTLPPQLAEKLAALTAAGHEITLHHHPIHYEGRKGSREVVIRVDGKAFSVIELTWESGPSNPE